LKERDDNNPVHQKDLISQLLQVRPGEYKLVAMMFLALLFGVASLVVGRAVRDALFLARHGSEDLPQVYMLQAVVVGLASYLYSRIVDRKRRDRVITWVSLFLAATLIGLRLLVGSCNKEVVFFILYLWIEVVGALLLIQFWTLANDLFHPREAKRLFGIIGAGSVFAGALGGFSVKFLAVMVNDTADLLYLSAGLIMLMVVCINVVGLVARERLIGAYLLAKPGRRRFRLKVSGRKVLSDPYLILISSVVVLTFVATTIIDYEFKIITRNHFEEMYPKDRGKGYSPPLEQAERFDENKALKPGSGTIGPEAEQAMAIFFGRFYGWAGIAACIFQLLLTARFLRYRIFSLLFLPLTLLPGLFGLVLYPGFIAAMAGKAADTMFRYTLNDSASQILYQPVPKERVGKAKAFIEGILKPGAIGLAGSMIILFSLYRSPALAGVIALVMTIAWMLLVPFITKRYHATMVASLIEKKLGKEGMSLLAGSRTARELESHLELGDDEHVLHALELLASLEDINLAPAVAGLLPNRGPGVQIAALKYLSQKGGQAQLGAILLLFDAADDQVRAEAVRAYCAVGKEKAIRTVVSLLEDASGLVRSAAVAGLIRYGGLDGILKAARVLKEMLTSDDRQDRFLAAQVLQFIGVKTFYREIMSLFSDDCLDVRRAAIAAAGTVQSPELLLALVYKLGDRSVSSQAAEALVKYGPSAVPPLVRALDQLKEDHVVRVNAASVLGELAIQEGVDCLVRHLDDKHEAVRVAATRGLVSARRKGSGLRVPAGPALEQIRNELKEYYVWLAADNDLVKHGFQVLHTGLLEKRQAIMKRVFGLLGLILDAREVDAIYEKLNSNAPRLRSTALDAVEYMLQHLKDLKTALMPIVDPESSFEDLERGKSVFAEHIPSLSVKQWIEKLLDDPSDWIRALALHCVGEHKLKSLAEKVRDMLSSESELLRETALFAAHRLGNTLDMEYYLSLCSEDPCPRIADAAKSLAAGVVK